MGLYRNREGVVVDIPDDYAARRGDEYVPVTTAEETGLAEQAARTQLGEERGLVGDINVGATRFLGGLSAGLSDIGLTQLLTPMERERLAAETNVRPTLGTVTELLGIGSGVLAAPGSFLSKSPAGYLSNVASREAEAALAQGGAAGVGKALGAYGLEGALQSAGSYLGHSAIQDAEVTAEGLYGALGVGGAFGAAGGAAALGIQKGAIAARRLLSKAMDGGEDALAASKAAWETQSKTLFEADQATADAARQQLAAIQAQKADAKLAKAKAGVGVREEQARAARVGKEVTEEVPVGATAVEHGAPAGVREPYPFETPEFKGANTVNLNIKPERPFYETAEFQGANTVNLGIRPERVETALSRVDDATLARPGARVASEGASGGIPYRGDDLRNFSIEDLKNLVDEPAVIRQEQRLLAAIDEFETAKQALDELYIPANKLGTLEADDVLDYMNKGGNFDEFEAARRNPLEDLGLAEPYVPAWSEQDLRKHFAQQGDKAALGTQPKTSNQRIGTQATEEAYELALKEAAAATTPEEVQAALMKVTDLETRLDLKPHSAAKIAKEAEAITKYEEASANLAEAVGLGAHPMSAEAAASFRAAADDAVRKATQRTARAVDDAETFGPKKLSAKERVAYAKERVNDASLEHAELANQETKAKQTFSEAKRAADTSRKTFKEAQKATKPAASKKGQLLDTAGGIELIGGIPGLKDLPVIGPLLSTYLKFRGAKSIFNKVMGRVPATGNTKAAAFAAQTKERIAASVDKMLGKVERSAAPRKAFPQMAAILGTRIYDNGEPDLAAKASLQEKAAARMREISDYVNTPNAIENDVRRELRDVTDPDLIMAAEAQRRSMFSYLYDKMPKLPPQSPFSTTKWVPSLAQAMKFARILEVVHDPITALEAAGAGHLLPEQAEALRGVYPRLFAMAQERLMSQTVNAKVKIEMPYRMQAQMSLLWDVPLAPSLEPDNIRILQSVYEPIPVQPTAAPAPAAPPQPSMAQPTNTMSLFQTAADRSALQR